MTLILVLALSISLANACNLRICQEEAYNAWAEFETSQDLALKTLDIFHQDFFGFDTYRRAFCDIFHTNLKKCLGYQKCHLYNLQYKDTTYNCWAIRRRSKELGFHLKYLPKAMMEYWAMRGQRDFYMNPEILDPICIARWLPVAPITSWCKASTLAIKNMTFYHRMMLRQRDSLPGDLHLGDTCLIVRLKTRHMIKTIIDTCSVLPAVPQLYQPSDKAPGNRYKRDFDTTPTKTLHKRETPDNTPTETDVIDYFCPFYTAIMRMHYDIDKCDLECYNYDEYHEKLRDLSENYTGNSGEELDIVSDEARPCPGDPPNGVGGVGRGGGLVWLAVLVCLFLC